MSDTTTTPIPAPTVTSLTPAPLTPQTPVPQVAEEQPSSTKEKSGILRVLGLRLRSRSSVLLKRVARFLGRDDGMSTAEYAVGTVAAVAFSAALYKVVTSDVVTNGLSAVIGKALNATF